MHPEDIDRYPERATAEVTLSNGQTAYLRPLSADDGGILGEYFLGLSKTTRGFYGPHPFGQATADKICGEIRHAEVLRMLATIEQGNQEHIIAYFLVIFGNRRVRATTSNQGNHTQQNTYAKQPYQKIDHQYIPNPIFSACCY